MRAVCCRRVNLSLGIWVPRRFLKITPGARQDEKNVFGFAGGCLTADSHYRNLTPAVKYVDQTYLGNCISDRLVNFQPFKSRRETELFYSTFEQKMFAIAVTPIPTKASKKVNGNHDFSPFIRSNNTRHDVRLCIGSGVQALQRRGIAEISVDPCYDAEAAAEGAYLAAFVYDELKSTSRQTVKPHISCYTDHLDVSGANTKNKETILAAWRRGTELAMAQNLARKWMEMPANLLSPMAFATQVTSVLEGIPNGLVRTKVRNADWCREQRMNGLLSVGAGSHRSVVFLEIVYEGDPEHCQNHVALVGKGVTFDSGGISIKPSAGMEEMRADMGGAAVVVSTIFGLANLRVPINVRAYLPLCENMPGGGAMRPGDVLRMANGLTVQVDNTDAEGRLILADALVMAHKHPDLVSQPALIIDIATLTGAISVALGDEFTGVFLNGAGRYTRTGSLWRRPLTVASGSDEKASLDSSDFSSDVEDADDIDVSMVSGQQQSHPSVPGPGLLECLRCSASARGDRVWNLPLLHSGLLREQAHLADLVNVAGGSYAKKGGSGIAASFLSEFVPRSIPWIHLDIAGVMQPSARESFMRKGMAGRPTRTIIEFLDRLSRC
ncbi:hypothetical protein EG68_04773 [Paragonimus skrjabini miyazakii]|uniref:Cytosol aminopeptidase domain-containing protein n=1 Tax=Paragonimus skrjabini miyazakii TaxID=59628 RepID=A0A8S9YWS9_9TREM|nr:hypothetical protein EG68_04773 [Paragonimus skrjabini miyazakii]